MRQNNNSKFGIVIASVIAGVLAYRVLRKITNKA